MRHAETRTWAVPVAVTLALAVIASCSGNNDSAPITTSQTAQASTTPSGEVSAQEVVTAFLDAHVAFDAEKAITYLTDEAVVAGWGDAESFRLEHALLEAQGYEELARRFHAESR